MAHQKPQLDTLNPKVNSRKKTVSPKPQHNQIQKLSQKSPTLPQQFPSSVLVASRLSPLEHRKGCRSQQCSTWQRLTNLLHFLILCKKTLEGSATFALPLGDGKFHITYLAQTLSQCYGKISFEAFEEINRHTYKWHRVHSACLTTISCGLEMRQTAMQLVTKP